jgi:uncharacterized membrane protein YkoI
MDNPMMNRQALALTLLSALLLSAAPVFAQPKLGVAPAEQEIKTEHASKVELKAFSQVKIALATAIAAANKHTSGGAVVDASFDAGNGKPAYKVKTYQNSSVWEGIVDAASGQVTGVGKTTPESELDQEDKAELAGLKQATTTLAQAVDTAEKQVAGKAISAGLEETDGKIVFEVMVLKNGSVRKIVIDPKTGQILT